MWQRLRHPRAAKSSEPNIVGQILDGRAQRAVNDYWRAKSEAERRGLDWTQRGTWPKELNDDLLRGKQ